MAKVGYESSEGERHLRHTLIDLFKDCPIPHGELLSNFGLFIRRQSLARMLLMNELYMKIVPVPGVVMEFGCRWGQNLALFESYRGMYEPFNHSRKIIGFDTFSGFIEVDDKDGNADFVKPGGYSVTNNYEDYLDKILDYHEHEAPMPHIKKYEIVKGDASTELIKYLEKNPETTIALAYFDMDLYYPTKTCLEIVMKHVTKGSIIVFDDLNLHDFPGETIAVKEVLGLDKYRLTRSIYSGASQVYLTIE